MSDRGRRGISRKNAGLLLALAFSLIAAGVVLFFLVMNRSKDDGGVAAAPPDLGSPPELPPAVTPGATGLGAVAATGRARLQFVDRNDPSRVAGEMEWVSLEPLEQRGRSMITEPRFWIYPENGWTIYIRAEQARVFQPDQQSQPESGRLERNVIVAGYPPGDDGQRVVINPETDRPAFLLTTDSLNFDTPIGEISTVEPWRVSTAEVEAEGIGLRVQVNELRERLELLEVDRGGTIRYSRAAPRSPGAAARKADEPAAPAELAAAEPAAETATPAGLPKKEDLYHAIFADGVRITQRARTLSGDNLALWVRLLDGALPDGAVPSGRRADAARHASPSSSAPASHAGAAPALAAAAAAAALQPEPEGADFPSPASAFGEDDIVLTWKGTLVVRPIEVAPDELQGGNHLALRVTADKTGHVAFADDQTGITGRCVWVGYRVTTQDLTLAGPGPAAVTVSTNDGKSVQVGRMQLNLGSGVGFIPGAGVLSEAQRRITWTDQSDLQFEVKDGALTGALREASFSGNVQARVPEGGTVTGDFLRAVFTSTQRRATALARLIVEGRAVADGGQDGALSADKLDLLFQVPEDGRAGDPEPRVLTAVGNVRAVRGENSLAGEFVEATLRPVRAGDADADSEAIRKVAVEDVRALGGVRLRGERGLEAQTEELFVNVPRQTGRLAGRGSFIGQGGDRVYGSNIELDGRESVMNVIGEGKFVHQADGRAGPLTATWTRSMSFNDRSGVVECHGDVVASTDPAGLKVELTRGEHLRLEFTPAPEDAGSLAAMEKGAAPAPEQKRELLRAEVSGDGENDALVESRTYVRDADDPEGRRLVQFVRLTGGRIIADDTAGTLSVPGAGRAAIYDGRATSDRGEMVARQRGDLVSGRSFRGSALFIWKGAMSMDRSSGLLRLRRAVQMVHRPLDGGPPATMECERLDATFAVPRTRGEAEGAGTELTRATARDAVYVESGGRKMLADQVEYDAAASIAEATADEGNRVTLYDDTRATPVTARSLIWNLATDRITVREPTPIVTPMSPSRR